MNSPKPPLDEEGVEPLQNRIDGLPGRSDRRLARRTVLFVALAAIPLLLGWLALGARGP